MTDRARYAAPLGAHIEGGGVRFRAFTTGIARCEVRLLDAERRPLGAQPLAARGDGHYEGFIAGIGDGALYQLVLDGRALPDPYARFLPDGVHGPAMVVAPHHRFRHECVSRPMREHVFYEIHIGTFTPEGTYAGARHRLRDLREMGVTAIELLPLSAFPGRRGWGYDGVAHYAPFAPYGTPDDLRAFVDDAHGLGLSVFLDVVYNHFGPSGNYLAAFSPSYFTAAIRNDWGDTPDYGNPVVRRYVIDNALYWLSDFRFDGLRLDAVHALVDPSPKHVLREMAEAVARLAPKRFLVAEDDRNDPETILSLGLDACWADDFHHQARATLTGERDGYYAAYRPGVPGIADTLSGGWLYRGQLYPPRSRPRGRPADSLPAEAFVYSLQNHDQVGNRALGDRLNHAVSLDAYCAVSTLLLALPMTPLLFMGQEWAASTPFQYFTDHEPELGHLVAEGRRKEFGSFRAFSDPAAQGHIPDPQDEATFARSRLRWEERDEAGHARVLRLYRALLALRRADPVLSAAGRSDLTAIADGDVLSVRLRKGGAERLLLVNFARTPVPWPALAGDPYDLLLRSDGETDLPRTLPPETALLLARRG